MKEILSSQMDNVTGGWADQDGSGHHSATNGGSRSGTAVTIAPNHICPKAHHMVVAMARVDSLEVQLRIIQGMVIAETELAAILTQDKLATTIN